MQTECPWLSPAKAVHFFSHVQMTLSGSRELRIKFFLISARMLYFPNWFQQEELRHISESMESWSTDWFGSCQASFDLHFLNSHSLACIRLGSCSCQSTFSRVCPFVAIMTDWNSIYFHDILSFHLGFGIKTSVMDRAMLLTYCEQRCQNWVLRHSVWACLGSHFLICCIWLTVSLFIHT